MTLTESLLLALLLLEAARFLLTMRQDSRIHGMNTAARSHADRMAAAFEHHTADMAAAYKAELAELKELCHDHASLLEIVGEIEAANEALKTTE